MEKDMLGAFIAVMCGLAGLLVARFVMPWSQRDIGKGILMLLSIPVSLAVVLILLAGMFTGRIEGSAASYCLTAFLSVYALAILFRWK